MKGSDVTHTRRINELQESDSFVSCQHCEKRSSKHNDSKTDVVLSTTFM